MKHRIDIVGSGVVGQATGRGFLSHGHDVTFFDIRADLVDHLRQQGLTAYLTTDVPTDQLRGDISILSLPTPTEADTINLNALAAAAQWVGQRLAKDNDYHVVVVRSTVVPGTTEELVMSTLERQSGKKVGRDFGLCMNPEYLREKTSDHDFLHPWLTVIGQYDSRSGDLLAEAYNGFSCPLYRITIREAEMQKYVHNLFNAVKITFFNEMRQIAQQAGVRAEDIFPLVAKSAEGMWRPEYGIQDKGPFDGMCLPKDTQAFLSWARARGWDMPLLATAIAVNESLPVQVHAVPVEAHAS